MKKIIALMAIFSTTFINHLFADDVVTEQPREGLFNMQTLIMIAIALVFFYFILWRPEQKRRKKAEEQRSSLKKGDRVTAMGIVGTVASIKDKTIILKMVDGSKIEMLKGAINDVQSGSEEEAKKADVEETSSHSS